MYNFINKGDHMKTIQGLDSSEIGKINEVLEMSEAEISKIKKQFTSIYKVDQKTVMVKDWMDDSIQIVKIIDTDA